MRDMQERKGVLGAVAMGLPGGVTGLHGCCLLEIFLDLGLPFF